VSKETLLVSKETYLVSKETYLLDVVEVLEGRRGPHGYAVVY